MAFQFLCPQGHLLEGEESQAGQKAQCPSCGSVFLVPQPIPAAPPDPSSAQPPAPAEAGYQAPPQQQQAQAPPSFQPPDPQAPPPQQPAVGPPPYQQPAVGPPSFQPPTAETRPEPGGVDFPGIRTEPEAGRSGRAAGPPEQIEVPGRAEAPIVHVVCPNGHQLETPREMLGQEALCPFCQVRFRLRLEDSVEYREEKAKERKRREIRASQLWLRWAIAAAVVVVLGLILLVILSL